MIGLQGFSTMADCDMCGKKGASTVRALVEGVEMNVCQSCAQYGERLSDHSKRFSTNVKKSRRPKTRRENPDENKRVVPDYGSRIKQAREKAGLKQEDLAKKLNEKESLLHKFESGHMTPNFAVARKFERFFHITLIESVSDADDQADDIIRTSQENQGEGLTMGDILKQALDKKK
ncbi:MAG: multiprotein bridging factor aMBF1 [Candidatus Woesearchaeota archaeon]